MNDNCDKDGLYGSTHIRVNAEEGDRTVKRTPKLKRLKKIATTCMIKTQLLHFHLLVRISSTPAAPNSSHQEKETNS